MHQTGREFYFSPTGGVRRVARALGSAVANAAAGFALADREGFLPTAVGARSGAPHRGRGRACRGGCRIRQPRV